MKIALFWVCVLLVVIIWRYRKAIIFLKIEQRKIIKAIEEENLVKVLSLLDYYISKHEKEVWVFNFLLISKIQICTMISYIGQDVITSTLDRIAVEKFSSGHSKLYLMAVLRLPYLDDRGIISKIKVDLNERRIQAEDKNKLKIIKTIKDYYEFGDPNRCRKELVSYLCGPYNKNNELCLIYYFLACVSDADDEKIIYIKKAKEKSIGLFGEKYVDALWGEYNV